MRLLDRFPVLLLDMNGTFMFGADRFGAGEDFHATYRSIGGSRLSPAEVTRFIRACYDGMSREYDDPECYGDFPSLTEGFQRYVRPPESELPLLECVFTLHEVGFVPAWAAALLCRLASSHNLALVTNIWAPKDAWLAEFKRVGIGDVFRHTVFSSDFRCIKPSPRLYHEALRSIDALAREALFVGDSLRYDIEGAKRVGLATVWLTRQPHPHPSVDYVLSSLQEIETLTA
jgi:putative hydrolase of the HAD superfamily